MVRSPFGGPSGNLLADGDFEFSTVGSAGAQLGWRGYTGDGNQTLVVETETGGLCRSGLRCAIVEPSMLMLLRGASAKSTGNVASGWAKIPYKASYGVVRPILISCDTFTVNTVLSAAKYKPDKDGWCHYSNTIPRQDSATCIYVDNTLKEGTWALLDAVVLGPDDGTVHPEDAEFWVPDAATVARLENMRAHELATMPLGRAPRRPLPTP
jgi:hypothetical protein